MYEEVGLALSEAANDKNCTLAVLTGINIFLFVYSNSIFSQTGSGSTVSD